MKVRQKVLSIVQLALPMEIELSTAFFAVLLVFLIYYNYNKGSGQSFSSVKGRRHSIYQRGKRRTEVPRHTEIVDELARKICKDLDVSFSKFEPKKEEELVPIEI